MLPKGLVVEDATLALLISSQEYVQVYDLVQDTECEEEQYIHAVTQSRKYTDAGEYESMYTHHTATLPQPLKNIYSCYPLPQNSIHT